MNTKESRNDIWKKNESFNENTGSKIILNVYCIIQKSDTIYYWFGCFKYFWHCSYPTDIELIKNNENVKLSEIKFKFCQFLECYKNAI